MTVSVDNAQREVLKVLLSTPWTILDNWQQEPGGTTQTLSELLRTYKAVPLIPPAYHVRDFPECTISRYYVALRTTEWQGPYSRIFGGKLAAEIVVSGKEHADKYHLPGRPDLTWCRLMLTG